MVSFDTSLPPVAPTSHMDTNLCPGSLDINGGWFTSLGPGPTGENWRMILALDWLNSSWSEWMKKDLSLLPFVNLPLK